MFRPGGVVRFAPRPINALRVNATDTAGALARAGLQTGDLVIGADGKLFENMMAIQTRLMTRKKSIQLTVARAGR